MNVVFDTGSDWLVVKASSCLTCTGTNFDNASSSTYVQLSTVESSHLYGSASLYGYNASDNVYLDSSATIGVTSFPWFIITEQ